MSTVERFQITAEQAVLYEERFVPAIFQHWVDPVLSATGLLAGADALDVACGTGILTRHLADRVGPDGSVVGLDLNPAMLEVAASVRPDVVWRQGDAAAIPYDDETFDVVTCQAAMMFFPDPTAALREMCRVLRPGGVVAVQVFDLLADQPAYGPWAEVVARHAGPDAIRMLGAYWAHGDRERMRSRCRDAGLAVTAIADHQRPAYFPSVDAMVRTEVGATPLAARLDDVELERIVADSHDVLDQFVDHDQGRLVLPMGGYVLSAAPP